MTVKAVYFIFDFTEQSPPSSITVAASVRGKILNGSGTGATFSEQFLVDADAPNVNLQIYNAVKSYLENVHSVTFSAGDTLVTAPSVL